MDKDSATDLLRRMTASDEATAAITGEAMEEEPGHRAVEQLLPLVPHLEIAHHIPGRIRLRVLLSGAAAIQEMDVEALVMSIPGVRGLRVNTAARSVVIDYDQERIPQDFWHLLGQLKQRPEKLAEISARIRQLWKRV